MGEVLTFCGPFFIGVTKMVALTPRAIRGLSDGEGRRAGTLVSALLPSTETSVGSVGPPLASRPSGLALPSLARTTAVASILPWVSLRRGRKPEPLTHASRADPRAGPREPFAAWGRLSLSAAPGLADLRVPQGELRISVLPAYLSYDAPWPVRKIPLRCTAHYVAYHVESKV